MSQHALADGALAFFKLEDFTISPLNPRKDVKPAGIDEIAESILEHGIIQPGSGRLTAEGKPEIMFGQRRFYGAVRACEFAEQKDLPPKYPARALPDGSLPSTRADELEWLPIIVRVLSDEEALEMMLIENLQREEASPREEADGYALLLDVPAKDGGKRYSLDSLAAKIGKSKSYVAGRLKLRNAPAPMWEAFEKGLIGTRHLELVGRIPHPAAREECAKLVLRPTYQNHPLTVVQTQELIAAQFVIKIKAIKGVDLEDERLVPIQYHAGERIMGGKCFDCPLRSGNCDALQDDLQATGGAGGGARKTGIDPNLCMSPACYQAKQDAAWKVIYANAEETGRRVMDIDRTEPLFETFGDRKIGAHSGLINLADAPDYHATGNQASEEEMEPWEVLLEGCEVLKTSIIARHPFTKKIVVLLEREAAIEAVEAKLKAEGKPSPFVNRPRPVGKKGKSEESGATSTTTTTTTTTSNSTSETLSLGFEDEPPAAPAQVKKKDSANTDDSARKALIERATLEMFLDAAETKLNSADVRAGTHAVVRSALVETLFYMVAGHRTKVALLAWLGLNESEHVEKFNEELWEVCKPEIEEKMKGGNVLPVLTMLLVSRFANGDTASLQCKDFTTALGIDVEVIRAQAVAKIDAQTEKPKGEELFTCEKCGQGNLTKRGLKAHNCEKRQVKGQEVKGSKGKPEKQMLLMPDAAVNKTSDPAEFARLLWTLPVHPSEPNASDVFTNNVLVRLCLPDSKAYAQIELATTKDGRWATGWEVDTEKLDPQNGIAGGLPHRRLLVPNRAEAVTSELESLINYLAANEKTEPLQEHLGDAARAFDALSADDEPAAVPKPVKPAPAAKAKPAAKKAAAKKAVKMRLTEEQRKRIIAAQHARWVKAKKAAKKK